MDKRALGRKGRLAGTALWLTLLGSALSAPLCAEVYQWRDADGRLHFGDEPPQDSTAEDLSKRYDNTLPFSLNFRTVDYALPPSLRNQLSTSVRKIFSIYKQALGVTYSPEQDFDIVLYGDEAAFRDYQRRKAPQLENPIGFYSGLENQITALAVNNIDALTALITHECSHAVSASHGRYTPIWLNEGLAEYFSRLHIYGLTAEVPVAPRWLSTLRRRGYDRRAPDMTEHLNALPPAWQQANGPDHESYALSWSLVYFLMDSRQGRTIIRQLLDRVQGSPLPVRDSAGFIAQRWDGGLAAFTRDWQKWLASADGSHRY
jgi:hypothetical protein